MTTLLRRLRSRWTSTPVLLGLLVLLLVTTIAHAGMVWRQSATLEDNVGLTGEVVNANVRTSGQVQRELLRLAAVLDDPTSPAAEVDLHRGLVGQRMREIAIPFHRESLGSDELLDEARAISETWQSDLDAEVRMVVAGTATPADVAAIVGDLAALELRVNQLASDAEINRRAAAGQANRAAVDLLASTRAQLLALVITLTAFVAVAATVVVLWRRFVRQREATLSEQLSLAANVRTLSQVASATDNMVLITDAEGRTEWVNEAFTRATGYGIEDLRGLKPGAMLQGAATDPATVAHMRERLAAGRGFQVEVVNYSRDGDPYWVDLEVQPVRDDDGVLLHFVAIQSDITERREFETRLVQAKETAEELADEKAMFLASMSHEIRTPLNAVIGLTGMLLDTELDDEQRAYATTARRSGNLLLELINNILSYSALDAGTAEVESRATDVRDLVDDTAALFAEQVRGKGIDLHVAVDAGVPRSVRTDPTRLRQVLVNLIGNAVKFTTAGRIDVEVAPVATDGGGVTLEFAVTDAGVGVPAHVRSRLFQPFTQADSSTSRTHGGTGLGLAISRQLVELLGGSIRVEDGHDGGARFVFTVVVEPTDAPAVDDAAPAVAAPTEGLRVLLAEDDAVNQIVAVHMVEALGHDVDVVSDGHAALEALQEAVYDVVLMDIHMPGLDGIATTRRIRAGAAQRQPWIIAMTANALDGDRERFLSSGMDGYVSKPVSSDALAAEIARVVGGVLTEA